MRVSRSSLPLGAWESPPRLLRLQLPAPESLHGSQKPAKPVSPFVSVDACLSAFLGVFDVNYVAEDPSLRLTAPFSPLDSWLETTQAQEAACWSVACQSWSKLCQVFLSLGRRV